jgi:hypothetical protein
VRAKGSGLGESRRRRGVAFEDDFFFSIGR